MSNIPRHCALMLEALKFHRSRPETLRTLVAGEWNDLLSRAEYARLMIPLSQVCGPELPDWVRLRIEQNISDNAERFERIKKDYLAIAGALRDAKAEHLVFKGFALSPDFVEHPRFRMQSDIDLYCPEESVGRARDAISSLGYEPFAEGTYNPGHHLAPLMRRTEWKWRGNFFDPEMPVSVELHCQLADELLARLRPQGLEHFWDRRIEQRQDDFHFPTFATVDHFGYCAQHVVRHLLSGLVPVYNVYELARFLHRNADNEALWNTWRHSHHYSIRSLQAICCYLAGDWFACRLPEEVEKEIRALPDTAHAWLRCYSSSPLAAWFHPNKNVLWLHLALLHSSRDRRSVLFATLFPKVPRYVAVRYIQGAEEGRCEGPRGTLRSVANYLSYVISRTAYHAHVFLPTLWRGVRLWWEKTELGAPFWIYFAASFFFDFGMFIFFFLYNLFLLDCGYREEFLGLVTSVTAVGSIIGTIAGGIMAQRLGLRKTLLFCFGLVPVISAVRLVLVARGPQLGLAFLASAVGTMSAVCYSPALAQVTNARNRAFAFSLVGSTLIGIGFFAGLAGGNLPGWIARFEPSATPIHLKQMALFIACGIMIIALWPASHLRFASSLAPDRKIFPRSQFLARFLTATAIWAMVTGSFSPFFNVYFSQHFRMPVDQIGIVFSVSQLTQVIAILATPVIFRKFGLIPGIMYMQIATAISLGLLGAAPGARSAAIVYTGFMAFQWMSEPGIDTLLMNRMRPADRSGASALNLLVISSVQAVVAVAAGASFARFGYPSVLTAVAIVALIAAALFRGLLGGATQNTGANIEETDRSDSISAARSETTTD
jgi:predicted MFS family arabinose efflux permease